MCVLNCNDRSCSELGVVFATETYDSTFRFQPASAKNVGEVLETSELKKTDCGSNLSVPHVISQEFPDLPRFLSHRTQVVLWGAIGYDEPPGRSKAALLQPQVERRMASTHGMNNTFATSKHMCLKCEKTSSRQMMKNVSSSTLCRSVVATHKYFFGIFHPECLGIHDPI